MDRTTRLWRSVGAVALMGLLVAGMTGCGDDEDSGEGATDTIAPVELPEGLESFGITESRVPDDLPPPSDEVGDFSFSGSAGEVFDDLVDEARAAPTRGDGETGDPVDVAEGISVVPAPNWEEFRRGDFWVFLGPPLDLAWVSVSAATLANDDVVATDVAAFELQENVQASYDDVEAGEIAPFTEDQLGDGVSSGASVYWQGSVTVSDGTTYQLESVIFVFVLDDRRAVTFMPVNEQGQWDQWVDAYGAMYSSLSAAPVDDSGTSTTTGSTPDEPTTTEPTEDTQPEDTGGGISLLPAA